MALLHTPAKDDTFHAPDFHLRNIDGRALNLDAVKGKNGTVVMFICNHCPYVKAVINRLVEDCRVLQQNSIGCVAIMPNDTVTHPEDSFDNMKKFSKEHNFTFPYLIDETQKIARAYGAVCTPDIFGFNAQGQLQYRGRIDSAGPNKANADTVRELRNAMLEIAKTGIGPADQTPSMGCSIKWK